MELKLWPLNHYAYFFESTRFGFVTKVLAIKTQRRWFAQFSNLERAVISKRPWAIAQAYCYMYISVLTV